MTGTHELPFDRLVAAMELFAVSSSEAVVVQAGTSQEPAPHCTVHSLLKPSEVDKLVGSARIVITHAGPASIALARRHGHVPIVVPRHPKKGEHVDGHQLAFARRLSAEAVVVEQPRQLARAIAEFEQLASAVRPPAPDPDAARDLAQSLGTLVDDLLVSKPTRQTGKRARLLSLIRSGWGR